MYSPRRLPCVAVHTWCARSLCAAGALPLHVQPRPDEGRLPREGHVGGALQRGGHGVRLGVQEVRNRLEGHEGVGQVRGGGLRRVAAVRNEHPAKV